MASAAAGSRMAQVSQDHGGLQEGAAGRLEEIADRLEIVDAGPGGG